ncbi:hypothetical protein PPERSA_06887 [Pseudocohnilembus persalinus]|uniref:Uncharacterized protein n=1 Tax=Pseudocohnilembus persalinus TaxID=266149 RepID=A0A0V0QZE5_PSEPJ|nr:hypothetical protein PPERSA_06887 [Pseudocohnilembus persalinus]|eukprot:KRX07272.1 hypothetical protein PPERSA_06887 [Pseudocohnilembus persalinus]
MFKICKNEHYSKEKNFYKCDQCNLLMCDNCQFEHGEQNQSHFVQNCGSISDPSNQQNTEELETSVNLDLSLIINGPNQAISPIKLNQNNNEEHKNTNQVGTSSTSETNERKNFSNINKIQSNASIKTNVQQQSKNKIRPNNLIFSSNNKSDKMHIESRDNSMDNLDLILEENEKFDFPNKSLQNGIQNIQHKQQEEKRFMQFKKILLQSVEGFLSEIKRSFNNIFVQKRQHIKQITEILEGFQQKRLVPIVLREDKNEIQQQLLKMKEQFNIVNNFTTNLPNFLIKTEYMSEIKQKLISFIQISDNTTKQWPQIQKLGQNANQIHKLPFYYPENNSIVLYDVMRQQQMIENMQNEENEVFLDQLPVHCQPIYHQTQNENKVFLIGGMEYCEQKNCYLPSKKNFVYDINTKKLTRIADSLIEKTKACTVKINDIIYQFGGVITHNRIRAQTCEKYLINEDKWESLTPMGQIRVMAQCCYIQNLQRIYIFGGITDEKQIQRNVEYYDIKNNKWQEVIIKNQLSYAGKHSGFAVNSYSKNEILLIGGFSFCQTHRSKGVQLFNINTNEITDMGDILPVGVAKDGRSSDPIIYNNELFLLNSIQSQIYDQVQQRNNEFITLAINSLRAQITDISKIQITE